MMTGYTETIRRYVLDNRYSGEITDADGIGEVGLGAEEAGRRIGVRLFLRLQDGRLDIRFQVFGCGFSVAACAATAELAFGRTLDEALAIDSSQIETVLQGLPVERRYCAELAAKALHAALASARGDARPVQAGYQTLEEDHAPRVNAEDPLYLALMDSPAPTGALQEDRQLFACLLTVAAREPFETAAALGLEEADLAELLKTCFPGCDPDCLQKFGKPGSQSPPELNPEVLQIIFSHLSPDEAGSTADTRRLARILAARAAHPGHLWVAMGLFERPQLSAAIHRHLPSLAAANHLNMRWKRFFFKQICDLNGGTMCKSPNCGDCSEYILCFPET